MPIGMLSGLSLAAFLAATPLAPAAAGVDGALEGSRWAIVEVYGEALAQDTGPYLAFEPGGRLSGRTACNWFHGTYSAGAGTIVLLTRLTTLRGCEIDNRRRADATLEALDSAAAYAIVGEALTLSDDTGEPVAKLERRDE